MALFPPVAVNQYLTEKVNLKLDAELLDALRRLALTSDRTIQAEMRQALRSHVKAAENGVAEQETPA